MIAECDYCRTEFEPRSTRHRFCSQPCRFASWVEEHPEWPEKRRQTLREARARKRRDKRKRHDENERGVHVWIPDAANSEQMVAKVERAREAKRKVRR
jgi:hypothetical protein